MADIKLYNIPDAFEELMIKAEEGELTQEEYDRIGTEIAVELQKKSGNIIGYYQNEKSLIDVRNTEIKRLQDINKAKQNHLDRLKKYVKDNMERMGISKIETELGTLKIVKNPTSVEIINQNLVPEEYLKVTTKIEVDKTKIKKNFKETGEVPDGIRIATDNSRLDIK